jgi:hypothetical protein
LASRGERSALDATLPKSSASGECSTQFGGTLATIVSDPEGGLEKAATVDTSTRAAVTIAYFTISA